MDYLPIFYQLKDLRCLVVGGGDIAARKASLLLRAGAHVRVVAPEIGSEMEKLLQQDSQNEKAEREFQDTDLEQVALAIAATDNEAVNRQVSNSAKVRHIPVNVVDNPELCTFILPSIVDRSPIVVAVSSGGQSPVLARQADSVAAPASVPHPVPYRQTHTPQSGHPAHFPRNPGAD